MRKLTFLSWKCSGRNVSGISCSGLTICGCTCCRKPSRTPLNVNFFIFDFGFCLTRWFAFEFYLILFFVFVAPHSLIARFSTCQMYLCFHALNGGMMYCRGRERKSQKEIERERGRGKEEERKRKINNFLHRLLAFTNSKQTRTTNKMKWPKNESNFYTKNGKTRNLSALAKMSRNVGSVVVLFLPH